MLGGRGPTCESAVFVSDKATFKSLHKLVKVDMDKSSLPKRRIRGKFVH
jgi:hypothetical protein